MKEYHQDFSNKEFWEAKLNEYVAKNACSVGSDRETWNYFKYCLQTQNRFFFQNPLVPIIEQRFRENTFCLSSGTTLYRARIDSKRKYVNLCWWAKEYQELKKDVFAYEDSGALNYALYAESLGKARAISSDPDFIEFMKQKSQGFEGFTAKDSGAPPYDKVSAGRCNPEKVVFLYAADTAHTAVAEVRPYVYDGISVAELKVKKHLNLVDFYYEYDEKGYMVIKDKFYHNMCSDFARLNKGNKDEYLITQYLSLLAHSIGFDGIRFRSSLVKQGSNYVIFDDSNCEVLSSKMYVIPEVRYSLLAILDE